jgi:hypothetical protein
MTENWTRHNFFDDIQKVSKDRNFPWKEVRYYTYDTGQQKALILSNTPLSGFEEIKNNQELLTYL